MSVDLAQYLTKWYVIIAGLVAVWGITKYIHVQSFIKKHGCKPAPKLEGGFLCIPILREVLKSKERGELLDFVYAIFSKMAAKTRQLRLFGVLIVITDEPENMKAMLATQFNDYDLGFRHAMLSPLLGDGIFTLDGEGWKHSRAMLRPQFAREQIGHVQALEPHLQWFAQHVRAKKGNTFDIQELFFRFTLDTATEFLFGESVHSMHTAEIGLPVSKIEGVAQFGESFNRSQHYLGDRTFYQVLYFLINNKEFRQCNANVHKVAKYFVNRALNFTPQELEEKSKSGYIFLYELVKQTRNPKVLQDQLLNILVAGRDTTAGTLSFTFYELARNPDVFEKLKTEIYEKFGSGDNVDLKEITFEALKQCEYLKFVLNEVLRLYPAVAMNFRVSNKETTLPVGGGPDGQSPVYIPKGTTVAYSPYFTHRDKDYYGEDAEVFRPERWADQKKLGWAYLPFNGGPRICLGQQFALTEASYVIVRLIQMFPTLVSKDDRPYPPKKAFNLTTCHHDGVFIQLQ
ncbi:cytochrome P450 52A13 (DH-ALK2) [Scheffersomyces xylosifermentans]|uniref:cytochrome P450 52A13 (DH-ALK2) n=1 Tax=Scheffersomyces xylosifermentans TaxID=1304137 RepID=UPI00315CABC9